MIADAEYILKVCGLGSYLHIGCGRSTLVFELLKRSADAFGLDTSSEIIAENEMRAPQRFFQGEIMQYPFDAESFDTIIIGDELLNFQHDQLVVLMSAVKLMAKKNIVLYFTSQAYEKMHQKADLMTRAYWEKLLLNAGLIKHARASLLQPYTDFNRAKIAQITFFEIMQETAFSQYPSAIIQTHVSPYLDPLRQSGQMADNLLSRYSLISQKIRTGDVVLELGCKAGHGVAILATSGKAKRVIGVDADRDIIAYAASVYGQQNAMISFQQSTLTKLQAFEDHSIDMIVAIDIIDKLENRAELLAEIKRVLKPDGRFMGSIPCMWKDSSGLTHQAKASISYDWKMIEDMFSQDFILEDRWAETSMAAYSKVPVKDVTSYCPDWWIFSAFADPRQAANIPYSNPFEQSVAEYLPRHIDFAKDYNNPWLYRVMVQLGERIADKTVLASFCIDIANQAKVGSADQGAALCVIAYQLLESGSVTIDSLMHLINKINAFDEAYDRQNSHAHRWSISLHYVGARLLLAVGNREEALAAFAACAEMDALQVTPLLATKTISARMYCGLLLASDQQKEAAIEQFKLAIKEAHRVMQNDWFNIIGDMNDPLAFGLPEAAEVLDIASQCAQALHALKFEQNIAGFFWEKINIKRFGLVEWNHSLERENIALRLQPMVA